MQEVLYQTSSSPALFPNRKAVTATEHGRKGKDPTGLMGRENSKSGPLAAVETSVPRGKGQVLRLCSVILSCHEVDPVRLELGVWRQLHSLNTEGGEGSKEELLPKRVSGTSKIG
mmetsp:Transcript_15821/g.42720  ORF Transcript_15821/g.42720 Transcript_15821/m.42720 type:complete len:115 (+) Transcript_15821:189-533(+)